MKERTIPVYLLGEPFVVIPYNLIMDKNSIGSDLLVYLAIASFLHGRQWGLPSQKEIMKRAKYTSITTIKTIISHLVEIGWATKIRRGLTQTNIIILHARKGQTVGTKRRKEIKDTIEMVEIGDKNNRFS